ncbi:amino acid permease [Paraburkholderia caballeronis]|uniref:Putative glutamate/gamma-aminobutyrate antiporter n=1 Tax=Paraburkholderia caballeronis TaxID=416943 RepID=A0A1H7MW98_9BURK|nr:amino acid permease [Paraburkholderia caballeronis]PXW26409.1 amino acid/polyamine/organocation transporter (APC superfamily) [Paraburkholderia caballeronis]PXX01956.1 amino acid/polyamine/organocation transporter (APC superfamily) [Paraburkholderia caballeronis]RAK01113.1 amino acid/polyamine/organocation transporter (APC superfamily) [Paraburkholderia caballeronis]TDV38315.1 amino acid/polyamine/organocation transporter (APC superfamily) [Paraburkholderia caballeronis]SEB97252.1 amino aci
MDNATPAANAPAADAATRGKYLGVTSIGLMTAAAVVTSLRGLPLLAKEEMTMFVYLAFTVVFYLIPASLVSAELGGAFADRRGGIYAWVAEAFGTRWGFLAIWLQWIQNVVWYPVALTFGAAALAYTIGRPELATNGIYVGLFCIVAYWLSTWVVLQGVEVFARIANWTFVIGTIVPGIVLLVLLGYWIRSGHPIGWQHLNDSALSQDGHARFWPAIHGFGTISFLAGIVLLFAGVEVQAVHVMDMRSPSRGYPAAIGLGALISVLIFALGALPIAAILPYDKISLQSGVFDAFGAVIGDLWHMSWLVAALSLLVGIGAISGVLAWLGSPSRGLLATAQEGELPPILQAKNRKGMPTHILLVQGLVVTVISCFYFVIRDVSVAFFLISAMTIALYLIAYMLMYAAAIQLRYSAPALPRPFRLPGGLAGMWLIAGIGFAGVLFSFVVSFFPPDQLPVGSPLLYTGLVVLGIVVFAGIPLIIHHVRRSDWASVREAPLVQKRPAAAPLN